MSWKHEPSELGPALRERVLARFGFQEAPPANLEWLEAVYQAWCAKVPFDNVGKMIALRANNHVPLPGNSAAQFFENWLADGVGGTCWPTSNALFELVRSLGFEARRVAGSMLDLGVIDHGSVKVTIDARDWLVDSSLLCNVPLPLDQQVFVRNDAVFEAEVEFDDSTHVIWSHTPPNTAYLPCRLIEDRTSLAFYLARYEESRARSPFNERLYARRNQPGELLILLGNTRFSKTVEGVRSRKLSPHELCEALSEDVGLSEKVIDEWVSLGSLAASFKPPSGPKPPPVTRRPPSQR